MQEKLRDHALVPWRLYTAKEVAKVMGISDKAVYAIPEVVLPRTRVGEAQSGVRYLGLYVMCYLLGGELPDVDLIVEEARRSIQGRARLLKMGKNGKTRVL